MNLRRDEGVSIVELAIAAGISMVVLAVLFAGAVTVQRTEVVSEDDSRSLGELRVSLERLSKELRQARIVYADSTAARIRFWVDRDGDNQQDSVERVIWESATVGSRAELRRSTDAGGGSSVVSDALVPGDLFGYTPAPPATSIVSITLAADVRPGSRAGPRTVNTQVRLRNVAA